MLQALNQLDTTIFLYLNSLHSPFFDRLMWLASDMFVWIPLYLWFLWLLHRNYPRHFWLLLMAIALMILASDQLSRMFKDSVARYRPSHDPSIQLLVHTVNGYVGGAYGFFSGHATNSFAVAAFMITMLKRLYKYIIPLALSYAVLVSYSRIYLGVHYPIDVITGAITGSLIGWGASMAYFFALKKISKE
jgi:undecaprenyl-diphosphatase